MRKLALAIVLVLVLVGSTVGGLAVATSSPAVPTLNVYGNSAPGMVSIKGDGWTPGVPVDLWLDTQDDVHHVAVATPSSKGNSALASCWGQPHWATTK